MQLEGAMRLVSVFTAVALRQAYGNNRHRPGYELPLRVLFMVASILTTSISNYWDICHDWSLLNPNSKNKWLRDKLILKHKSIYWIAMASPNSINLRTLEHVVIEETCQLLTFSHLLPGSEYCAEIGVDVVTSSNPGVHGFQPERVRCDRGGSGGSPQRTLELFPVHIHCSTTPLSEDVYAVFVSRITFSKVISYIKFQEVNMMIKQFITYTFCPYQKAQSEVEGFTVK